MATLHLHFEKPDGETDTYHLNPGRRYHIGRGSQCEIRILDMKMSRQHCAIEHLHGVWLLVDLASTNGVTVDAIPVVGRTALRRGQTIQAGNTVLKIETIDTESHRRATTFDGDETGQLNESGHELKWDSDFHPAPDTGALTPISQSDRQNLKKLAIAEADDLTPSAGNAINESGVLPMQTHMPLTDALEIRSLQASAASEEGIYLDLLGKEVGPLNKQQADELQALQRAGKLTNADLAQYERQ